ncbi:hypothetical protein [Paenirhodobacter sp.]|uniref:hypothetical protein n=1 Tax=Paenirhodobacter sp. TaxID=1965326 RepID=UPI003B425182
MSRPRLRPLRPRRPSPPKASLSLARLREILTILREVSPFGALLSFGLVVLYTVHEGIPLPGSLTQGLALIGITMAFFVIMAAVLLGAFIAALPITALGFGIRAALFRLPSDSAFFWITLSLLPLTLGAFFWALLLVILGILSLMGLTVSNLYNTSGDKISQGILIILYSIAVFVIWGTTYLYINPNELFSETALTLIAFFGIGAILTLPVFHRTTPSVILAIPVMAIFILVLAGSDRPILRYTMEVLNIRSGHDDILMVNDEIRDKMIALGAKSDHHFEQTNKTLWTLTNATLVWSALGGPSYVRLSNGQTGPDRVVELPAGSIQRVYVKACDKQPDSRVSPSSPPPRSRNCGAGRRDRRYGP